MADHRPSRTTRCSARPLAGSTAAAPGVYFLRVTDATGRSSRTARVAVLR